MTTPGNSSNFKPASSPTKFLNVLEPKLTPLGSLDRSDLPALGLSPGGPASTSSSSGWNAYHSSMALDQYAYSAHCEQPPRMAHDSIHLAPFAMKTEKPIKPESADENIDQDMSDNNDNDDVSTVTGISPTELAKLPAKERRRLRRLVHPANRKRVAVACDSCKRRKQRVCYFGLIYNC